MAIPQFDVSFPGTNFICNLESFRATPYKDPGGDGNWVIGFGTELTQAEYEIYEKGISRDTGMFLFSKSIQPIAKQLSKTNLVSLMQHQKDAIMSLVYNIGMEEFLKSTIYQSLFHRSPDLIPWTLFVKGSDGQQMPGLLRRRHVELRLFIYANYSVE